MSTDPVVTLTDALAAGEVVVLDGGLATQLEARGHDPVSYTHLTLPTSDLV